MASDYVTKDKDRLDLVCWNRYGRLEKRIVESVLVVNPGLADQPIIMPEGIRIILPDLSDNFVEKKEIKLWS